MMQALFLIAWTTVLVLAAGVSWVKIAGHWKVYLMMGYNWIYLSGVFFVYPNIPQFAG